ncbi:unnamed protein product [Colias eurytheme]|nr:unnamed protein product [Colias eurytheme]
MPTIDIFKEVDSCSEVLWRSRLCVPMIDGVACVLAGGKAARTVRLLSDPRRRRKRGVPSLCSSRSVASTSAALRRAYATMRMLRKIHATPPTS